MGRKRNPYLPLYTRDIMSSPRCRALSTTAAGVYLFLLCRLNEPPTPGAFRLSDWEQHPTWRRSLTQQCLANADKYSRLQYFARYLSKNDLPWDKKEVLAGLQELYNLGIIVVEGDMLVQPRMFKDNGFELPDLDNDGDPEGTILDDPASGSMASKGDEELSENNGAKKRTEKGTKKVHKKVQKNDTISRARASRALSVEYENNNIRDNKEENNIDSSKPKTEKTATKKKPSVADNPPTIEEIQAYFDERAQQGKPFIYVTPETFFDACEQSGWKLKDGKPMVDWRARVRTFENYRRDRGDQPIATRHVRQGEAVQATEPHKGKYKKW